MFLLRNKCVVTMKHLMILRCGQKSIHSIWIHYVKAVMDVAFVYYDDSDFSTDKPTYSYYSKGTKLTGVHDFISNNPSVLEEYDFFWLFEDDLIISYESVQQIVEFVNNYQPALSAPTLSLGSFITHAIALQIPSLFIRGTDFVECMAPIMSRSFLHDTLQQFIEYPIWGIERYWQHLLWNKKEVAILYDQWPITHTRPVGSGTLYKVAQEMSINHAADEAKAFNLFGKKFNKFSNILFGVEDKFSRPFLTDGNLRKKIQLNSELIGRLYGNDIRNKILQETYFSNDFFVQFLSFPKVQKLLNLPNITEQESSIIAKEWSFGNFKNNVCYGIGMNFNVNGTISGYYNKNECYWKIVDGHFAILSKDKKPTTIFNKKEMINNKTVLIGEYVNNKSTLHYLKEH